MGTRFVGTFIPYIDDGGTEEVTVEIIDTDGGGSLPMRIVSFNVFGEGESREPLAPIQPGRCELTFLIEDETYEEFITDLINQVTDRFYVRAQYFSFDFFVGLVTHEYIDWEDMAYPFEFTVNATDGLTRMRDLDYLDENGDPYSEAAGGPYFSAIDTLVNCFSKLNLDNIYDTSFDKKRIWVNCKWYATNMKNTSDNPLEMIFINNDMFYDYDNDGNLIADSCEDVLLTILEGLGLQIKFGRGIYRIDQISSRDPDREFYWNYNFDGSPQGTRTQSWNKQIDSNKDGNIYPKAIGRFSSLPALRQVKVVHTYGLDAVAIEPDEEYGFGGSFPGTSGTQKICYQYPVGHPLSGTLRPFGRFVVEPAFNPIKFRVHFQLMVRTTGTGVSPEDWVNHKYHMRIYLHINGVKPDLSQSNQAYSRRLDQVRYDFHLPLVEQWNSGPDLSAGTTINSGGYDFLVGPIETSGLGSNFTTKYYDLGFETIEFPDDLAHFRPYVCVELTKIITEDNNMLGASYTTEFAVSDLTVIYAESNNRAKPTKKTIEYESSINEGGKGEKTINVRIGDRGNSLLVDNGSKLEAPGGWGVGAGSSLELGELLAQEYHKVRGKPIMLLNRTVIGRENNDVDMMTTFNYRGLSFLALPTNHNFYNQEISGTWYAAKSSYNSPEGSTKRTRAAYDRYHRLDNPEPASPGALIRLEERGRDGSGFTANTNEYVVTGWLLPDPADHDVDYMNKHVEVYRNGEKLEYTNVTPVGPTFFTINISNNSIVLDTNFPLSPRHRIQVIQV